MTPNPTSGFFQMFPEDQVRNTDWSVDLGIKIVLSGGLLAPATLHTTTPTHNTPAILPATPLTISPNTPLATPTSPTPPTTPGI